MLPANRRNGFGNDDTKNAVFVFRADKRYIGIIGKHNLSVDTGIIEFMQTEILFFNIDGFFMQHKDRKDVFIGMHHEIFPLHPGMAISTLMQSG